MSSGFREFYSIADLLAHLCLPSVEIMEGFCSLGRLSSEVAQAVQANTGLAVGGFALVLDRSGVQHTFKQHGMANAASETAQGQIPIEEADLLALPTWVLAPQIIRPGQLRPGQQPMPCIEFYGTLPTGRVYARFEFRPRRKRLALVTMCKKKTNHLSSWSFGIERREMQQGVASQTSPPLKRPKRSAPGQIYIFRVA